jgi:endoglucanase
MQASAARSVTTGVDGAARGEWRAFIDGYVAPEGRVIDTGNGGVTHSEGQGYGMLFAEHFGDRATFDKLLGWTQRTLRHRDDALHAWRYRPHEAVAVDDPNNATDGDLLIALALLRGGQRWSEPRYTDLAGCIGADLLRTCVREIGGATVLLPAAFGFEHGSHVVINPSYYVFPALAALAAVVPDPAWDAVQADGVRFLRLARFGRWALPPDWLRIADGSFETLAPAPGWPARFSWDAVRVPLHLAWAGLTAEPALHSAASFWKNPPQGRLPAWVDLATDRLADFGASRGVAAIAAVAHASATGLTNPDLPHVADAEDYYSAALVLLSRVVWQDSRRAAAAG